MEWRESRQHGLDPYPILNLRMSLTRGPYDARCDDFDNF
jgi:hypothetical protein